MRFRTVAARRLVRILPLACLLAVSLWSCSLDHYPQTALRPLSDYARIGDDIQTTTFKWAVLVFVLVEGALLFAVFRFRGRPDDAEPRQVHGNTLIEIIWTVIPALILAAIAVPTVRGIFETNTFPKGDALKVEVVGHQWWWEFRYPDLHLTTANELHVPVGQTVEFRISTSDVVHSFWPPRFAGKRDAFPNRETRLWFKAESAGEYPGQCAEFCGIQHGRMAFRIRAQTPDEFQSWVAHMQTLGVKPASAAGATGAPAGRVPAESGWVRTASAGARVQAAQQQDQAKQNAAAKDSGATKAPPVAPQNPLYTTGEKLFASKGCIGCHSLVAFNAPQGMIGPNLANVGARSYIAAGTLKNTDENLARWIRNAQAVKVGVLMPNLGVTENEAKALVAFLRAHR